MATKDAVSNVCTTVSQMTDYSTFDACRVFHVCAHAKRLRSAGLVVRLLVAGLARRNKMQSEVESNAKKILVLACFQDAFSIYHNIINIWLRTASFSSITCRDGLDILNSWTEKIEVCLLEMRMPRNLCHFLNIVLHLASVLEAIRVCRIFAAHYAQRIEGCI
jgi:disulfide bond formation protein DsbB